MRRVQHSAMTLQVKVLAAKAADLSYIPKTHMVERESLFPQFI